MLSSEDYFLLKLGVILLPAFILFIGALIISFFIIKRYSVALNRLFAMNFNGVELERKRIANDLHDEVGFTIAQIRNVLYQTSLKQIDKEAMNQLNIAENLIGNLHLSLRQTIKNIYPRELMYNNWKHGFVQMANCISIGGRRVEIEIDFNGELSTKQLHQMFRLSQEIIANIFTHSMTKSIIFQIYQEKDLLHLSFTYLKSKVVEFNPKQYLNGRGSFIIKQ